MGWLSIAGAACTEPPPGGEPGGGRADEDQAPAVLPACVDPDSLFATVFEATMPVVERGTLPPALYATSHNRANRQMLLRGPEIFPRTAERIREAQHEVALQFYVWEVESDPAADIYGALTDLQQIARDEGRDHPVNVRIIVDAFNEGSPFAFPGDYRITKLMPKIAGSLEALDLDPALVRWELAAHTHNGLGNLHTKDLIVDGRVAIIGGANVESVHNDVDPWNDSAYELEGEVARSLLAEFDNAWLKSHPWTCGSAGGSQADCTVKPKIDDARTLLPHAVADDACEPMMVVTRKNDANPAANRVDNTQDQAFLAAFGAAKHRIRVMTPNLNDDHAKKALVEAVRRGVEVEVVLSLGFNDKGENLPGQGGTNEENVASLYEDKLADLPDRCERFRLRWYASDAGDVIDGNGPLASHAKYTSIDGEIVIVGGANMDTQAWNHSRETNVLIASPEVTAAWDARMFEAAFARGAIPAQCGGAGAP